MTANMTPGSPFPWLTAAVSAGAILALSSQAMAIPRERSIEAAGPQGPLKGTLTMPDGKMIAAVLIIPGSGPTDRDGNSPLGIKASTYRLVAGGLAEHAIASVRIDKRGMFASAGAVPDPNNVTISEYSDDVHAWVRSIRQNLKVNCVWVMGHSEGGLVALKSAATPDGICGLILVSTAGEPAGELLIKQIEQGGAPENLVREVREVVAALRSGEGVDVSKYDPPIQQIFPPAVQRFIMSEFSEDPAKLVASVGMPVLIVQGDRDLQVSVKDAQLLAAANPRAKLVILPNVNHVLKHVETDGRGANMATYADADLPLDPSFTNIVVEYIGARGINY